jgi:hypothetical protein
VCGIGVVSTAAERTREDVPRLIDASHLLTRALVRVPIRVIPHRKASIGLLYLRSAGITRDPEDRVWICLRLCHRVSLSHRGREAVQLIDTNRQKDVTDG